MIDDLLIKMLDIFGNKEAKLVYKIILFILIIISFLFINNIFYFSDYLYYKHKLEIIQSINLLLENENISVNEIGHLIKMKKNIMSHKNIFKILVFKYDLKPNIILYIISSSFIPIILLIIIFFTTIFNKEIQERMSFIDIIISNIFLWILFLPSILGFPAIFSYIDINCNIYFKNIILCIISHLLLFLPIIFIINLLNNKN